MLGSGGQADVFVSFDEQMKRRVAIKRVPLHDVHASVAAIEEARTAAMLTHPNIITMYDFSVTETAAYLIMEHVDGVTLADIASEDITDEIVAAVVRDVGEALTFAHKNGVLHLDIKPANILINHEGHIKVIDFGVASLSRATDPTAATAGTVGYMPPEQQAGQSVSPATDQWAYAAVIYELLTGENPALEETLDVALSADPLMRFASVKDCRQALLADLPAPRAGRKQLAEIVAALTDDDIADTSDTRPKPRSPFAGCFSVLMLIAIAILVSALTFA